MKVYLQFIVQLHLIFAIRWMLFITCYLWLAIWIFLYETCYFLQKLVPFARCCTSRNFWYYGWKSFIYIVKIFTILVDLWTKFEKVYKNDLKNIINKMFRIGFHISYLIKIHQKLFCTQNKRIDVVFFKWNRYKPYKLLISWGIYQNAWYNLSKS